MSLFRWRTVGLALLLAVVGGGGRAGAAISFNDPKAPQQWYLEHMNFGGAWTTIHEQPTRGQITVAVIDSGFDLGHKDLGGVDGGINIVDGSQRLGPVHPHGTATLGTPGAHSGNAIGISQAAWTSRVMPIRATNRADGVAYTTDLANGIRYAADHGARVINISYGGVQLAALEHAAAYAQRRGAVVIMAAGNAGRWMWGWENHNRLVAVGSVGRDGRLSSFSSRGGFVDLVAPGEDFTTFYPDNRYANWSGTSFSAPLVASVASLMLTANPDLSPWQVRWLLKRSATDLGKDGRDGFYGWGLPDAQRAVELALAIEGAYADRPRRVDTTRIANDLTDWEGLVEAHGLGTGELVSTAGFLTGITAVPEPTSAAILLSLTLPAALRRRRPRR